MVIKLTMEVTNSDPSAFVCIPSKSPLSPTTNYQSTDENKYLILMNCGTG